MSYNTDVLAGFRQVLAGYKAYPVDSGRATCCVLSNRIRAVIGTNINGQRAFAFPIPEGIF
jgi:hypothetical protein